MTRAMSEISSNLSFLGRDKVRHKYDMIFWIKWSMPSVKFEQKPVLSSLKAFLLIDSSIILNWLLIEEQISPPEIASVGYPSEIIWLVMFCNAEYTVPILLYRYHPFCIHPSGVVFKGVLEFQIRNSLSARKWVIISKIWAVAENF